MAEREELITIESLGGDGPVLAIDRATRYELVRDMTAPSEARFEMGDDGTWAAIADAISIGRRFRVALNGVGLMAGRLLMRGLSLSPQASSTVQLTVRTRLADALFASCLPVAVKKSSLKDVLLRAYGTLGLTEADFLFDADVSRDLLTGRGTVSSSNAGPDWVEALKEEDAKVHPPETVFAFADRHLRRFGLLHWDAPDGRIVVASPNDLQRAVYRLQCLRAVPGNNVLSARRTEDYEQVPDELWVYGKGGARDINKAPVAAVVTDEVLGRLAPSLNRRAMVIDESIKTSGLAEARAKRELAMRSLQRDSWDLSVRGWSYHAEGASWAWALDTVAEVAIDVASPVAAPYYIWRIAQTGNADEAHTTVLTAAAQGVWRF